jgi:hypothetical protein
MAKQPSITTLSQIVGNETSALNTINNNFSNIQTQFDLFLSLNGDTPNSMTADLDMNSNRILNTGDPTNNQDAATKKYVDNAISSAALGSSAGIANSQLFVDGVDFTAGSSTQITLSEDPGTDANLTLVMDGMVMIEGIEWTRSGTTVTFLATIPADVTNIEAKWNNTINNFTVADDSVTSAKLAAEAITGQTTAVVAAGDTFLFTDADDSNGLKKDTVQGILDLAPAFASTDITGQTDTAIAAGDSILFSDVDDSGNLKKDTVQGILDLVPTTAAAEGTAGIAELATAAEMETATNDTKIVTPLKVNRHPGTAKGWIKFNGTGTIAIDASKNVSGIVDNGTGWTTITWDTDFSSADYAVVGTCQLDTSTSNTVVNVVGLRRGVAQTAGAVDVQTQALVGSATGEIDNEVVCVNAHGDQ